MAAKKRDGAVSFGGKKAFILSQPPSLTAREVVVRAKNQGLTISEPYVYIVRGGAKSKGAPQPRRTSEARASGRSRTVTPEESFANMALELGVTRALSLLEQVRAKARSLAF